MEADNDYVNKFHNFENASKIINKISLKTEKLDDINFDKQVDLFKIDVQGFESVIIENGKKNISNSLVVQLELSPVPIYKNEKTYHICSYCGKFISINLLCL